MSRALFHIGKDLEYIEELIESNDGILDDKLDAYIVEQLKTLTAEQDAKADGYIHLVRRMEMTRDAAKEESQRYLRISQIQEAAAERLKLRLKEYMIAHDIKKIQTPTGRTISVQANGCKVPVVYLPDIEAERLPPEFQKMVVQLDGAAVRSALESGRKLPFAEMGVRGTQLRISGERKAETTGSNRGLAGTGNEAQSASA